MASLARKTGEAAEPVRPAEITDEEVLRVRDMLMVRLSEARWPQNKIALLFNRSQPLVNHVVNSVPVEAIDNVRGLWP